MPSPTRPSPTPALVLATVAFATSFFAWSMLGPLGPDLQEHLGISEFALAVMVALPVLMGSIMRIPLGILAERHGGRLVFSALLLFTLLPLVALALWHDSYAGMLAFGFLLGFAGASFAIGVPFVNRWYPPQRQGFALGVYGMGMIGSVAAGFTAPKIAKAWGLAAPFWIAAGLVVATLAVFALLARPAGGVIADRIGAERVLRWSFTGTAALAAGLAATYTSMPALTACCLTMAVFLGLGTGAVFKLVPQSFPDRVGAITGVVGAAGGLGGFFPPLVMGIVKSATGGYALGFVLLSGVAVTCLAVLRNVDRTRPEPLVAPFSSRSARGHGRSGLSLRSSR
jgi:NNP family nitrate/nitrite transporter-like MFS transporter